MAAILKWHPDHRFLSSFIKIWRRKRIFDNSRIWTQASWIQGSYACHSATLSWLHDGLTLFFPLFPFPLQTFPHKIISPLYLSPLRRFPTRVVKPNRSNRLTECLNRFDRNRKPQKVTWTEPIKILLVFCIILTNFSIFCLVKKYFWANIKVNNILRLIYQIG